MPDVDPEALQRLAQRFETEVGGAIANAKTALDQAQVIEYSNFTNVHIPLATVYVEAWNFAHQDLDRKQRNAAAFHEKLVQTAQDWIDAEHASSVKVDGS